MYAPTRQNVTGQSTARRVFFRLLHLVLPAPCLSCDEPLERTRDSLGLCDACRGRLVPWPPHGCRVCQRPLSGAKPPAGLRCGRCRKRPPAYEQLVSAWAYQEPLDAVLLALKFRRLEYLGEQLGRRLADRFGSEIAGCDLVVPIPLHWRRLWARGYNQADVIARSLARSAGLPRLAALRRQRPTPAQSRLPRSDRKKNLADAFRSKRPVEGRRILLVDDVVTTGATLEAAATCLHAAGAHSILALAAARTPDPREADAVRPPRPRL